VIQRNGKPVNQQEVTLRKGRNEIDFRFTPRETGLLRFTASIPLQTGEVFTDNNEQTFVTEAEQFKLRVLYMEGTQYRLPDRKLWEYQYLVQALEEDKKVRKTQFESDPCSGKSARFLSTCR